MTNDEILARVYALGARYETQGTELRHMPGGVRKATITIDRSVFVAWEIDGRIEYALGDSLFPRGFTYEDFALVVGRAAGSTWPTKHSDP
jgi:hypothetical protein